MSEIQKLCGTVRIRRKRNAIEDGGFLIHYGIKGQKWGLRRFQNEDRSLTEEGKKRYNKESREERKARKQAQKTAKEAAKPESSKWKAKEAKHLTDDELNRRNSRLQRERQYIDMTTPGWKKAAKRGAIAFVGALTLLPLMKIATDTATKVYRGEFNQFVAPWLQRKVGLDNLTLKTKG